MKDGASPPRRPRILLVGEDFGRSPLRYHSDRYALTGRSGERVAELAGLGFPTEYARVFARSNVVELPSGWSDPDEVRDGLFRLAPMMLRAPRTILLGRRVAAAFGLLDLELLEWKQWQVRSDRPMVAPEISRLPHPSGRNRWWNDPTNVRLAETFLRDTVRWATS